MNAEWRELTLGEFVRLQRGHDLTAVEQKLGSVPVMGSAGPNGTHAEAIAKGPGVVIGRSGASMGKVHFCDRDYWPHNTCLYVTDFLGNDPLFVYYKLAELDLARYNSGSAQPSLNRNYIYGLKLSVPDPAGQRKISGIIRRFDEKIDLNSRINQTLGAMAQAIFKSWFVDFDPVKAKIAAIEQGQDPLCAAMRAISGKTDAELDQMPREHHDQLATAAALFPDAMEESELGDVPKRWNVVTLSKMIQLIGGGTPKRSESSYWGGAIPWFSVRDVPENGNVWVIDTEEKITLAGLQKSSTKLLREGTTIISARGTVGKLALVGTEMAMNQSCYGVVGAEGVGEGFNYFNLKEAVEKLKRNTHGAVFDTITQATFETVLCVRPEDSVMKKFDETVGPLLRCIKSNVLQSRELAALRDTLLPKLLSGGVSVETLMNEVAQ